MPATNPINILVVGDYSIFRNGLKMLLETISHYKVIGEAANLHDAHQFIERQKPDVILIDVPEINKMQYVSVISKTVSQIPFLLLTTSSDNEMYRQCLRSGASGLFLKENNAETLFKAIEKIFQGEFWFDRAMMGRMLQQLLDEKQQMPKWAQSNASALLSEREKEVLALVCKGKKNKIIADDLFITETTVRHHLTSIFDKLKITNRLELVIYAFKNELVKVPEKSEISDADARFLN